MSQQTTSSAPSRAAARETFLFADLCGFTEYTCRHGDELAADLATRFHQRVRELAADEGCEVVKAIGDAVMVHSTDCRKAAVRLACRILSLRVRGSSPDPRRRRQRLGGELDGDWYGSTVNAAARVADAATPGEVLLTERVRTALAAHARSSWPPGCTAPQGPAGVSSACRRRGCERRLYGGEAESLARCRSQVVVRGVNR